MCRKHDLHKKDKKYTMKDDKFVINYFHVGVLAIFNILAFHKSMILPIKI